MGNAHSAQPVPAIPSGWPAARGSRTSCNDLRPVHRRIRDIRHAPGQGADRGAHPRATQTEPPCCRGRHMARASSLPAMFTSAARVRTFILRMTLPRCAFTVISLIPTSPATCLFKRPETTRDMTWRSRWLRRCVLVTQCFFFPALQHESLAAFERQPDRPDQGFPAKRLCKNIESACLHGLDGTQNVRVAGHADHRHFRALYARASPARRIRRAPGGSARRTGARRARPWERRSPELASPCRRVCRPSSGK